MPRPNPIAIALANDGQTAEVVIRGFVGGWNANLEDIDAHINGLDVGTIRVRINTLGGYAHEGIAIHNILRAHPARVEVIVEGVAGSAGSIIAMAGDEIVMYANALMMIHGAKAVDDWGDPVDTPEARAMVAAWNESLVETYVARTGKTEADIRTMLTTDTWMTARQAVAEGFADRVEELHAQAEDPAPINAAMLALASATGIPAEALARAQAEATASATAAEGGDPASGAPTADTGTEPPEQPPHPNSAAATATTDDPATAAPQGGADPNTDPAPAEAGQGAAVAATTLADQISAMAVAAGLGDFVATWLLDDAINSADQARAAIANAREVRALCLAVGADDLAPELIRARATRDQARTAIAAARAAAGEATHTRNHLPPDGGATKPSATAVWKSAIAKLPALK